MYVFGSRRLMSRGGELMRGLGLWEHGGVLGVCQYLGCGGVGGAGVEGLDQSLERWGSVMSV